MEERMTTAICPLNSAQDGDYGIQMRRFLTISVVECMPKDLKPQYDWQSLVSDNDATYDII